MSANCFSFWETSSPDPLLGLRLWIPLGDFRPAPDPLGCSPRMKISGVATALERTHTDN